jgi:hypothetical protein
MDGLKTKKEAAERAARREVPTIIGHLADFDKAGGDIGDAFAEDVKAFSEWHRERDGTPGSLYVERIALTEAQARKHKLLDDDGKAEVDGLPVPELDKLVRKWIESHLDADIQRGVVEAESQMRIDAARLLAAEQPEPESDGEVTDEDWSWAR